MTEARDSYTEQDVIEISSDPLALLSARDEISHVTLLKDAFKHKSGRTYSQFPLRIGQRTI